MQLRAPRKKTNFVFIAAFIIALIFAIGMVASVFINWDKFKPTIEAKASEALGRKVSIQGKISGTLLPVTQVTAGNIVVDNIDGGKAPQFLKMESLEVQLSPFALLSGKLEIGYVHLIKPEIYLEKYANNKTNWNFGAAKTQEAEGGGAPNQTTKPIPQLNSLKIEKGKIFYTDLGTGAKQVLENLDLDADLNLAAHQAQIDASGDWQGQKASVKFAAKPGKDENLDADLSVKIPMGELSFDGNISDPMQANGKPVSASGNFKFAANLKPKVEASGKLNYNGEEIKIAGLQITGADMKGQGDILVKMQDTPFVDAKLDFDTIDAQKLIEAMKSWQADLAPSSKSDTKAAQKSGGGLGIKGNGNISIAKLTFASWAASNVRIQAATMDGRNINLQRFAFQTTGDTNVEGSGSYDYPGAAFDGRVQMTIANLQKLAEAGGYGKNEWIKAQPSRVEFQSGIAYGAQKISLKNYDLRHGDLKSSGDFSYVLADNPDFDLKASIQHPSIKKLFAKPDLPVDSKLALNTDLGGRIVNQALDYPSMQGKVRAELNDGILKGVDWKKVSLDMQNINSVQDLLRVLDVVQRQKDGQTPFKSLTSDWTVVRGVATSSNIALDSDVAKMVGGGTIKLAEQQMDITARVNFTDHPKVPPLGVRLSGNIQAPQYAFDTTAMSTYYASKAINKVIEKNVDVDKLQNKLDKQGGKLLKKLLGQ